MYWDEPYVLLGLWLLPVIAGLLVYAHRRRTMAASQFADPAMVARLMPALRGPRPWIKGTLLLLGVGLLVVAGARPRFGVYFEKVSQRGADVFVLLDVSRSMTAQDVAPSRLERAKSDIRDLLDRLVGDRVGLIVFAGKPMVRVPLTADHGFFLSALEEVDTRSAPRGGTLIGDAIRRCLEVMPVDRSRDQAMVLITDGEDHDSYPLDAATAAAERGVKIFTVGLGDTREGARIPMHDQSGQLRYLKDKENKEHWSKLDERPLKEIALATQGAYIPAGTRAYDLGQVYNDHLANLSRGEYQAEKRKRYAEQFQLFVCLGVALLLLEMAIPAYRAASSAPSGSQRPIRSGSPLAAARTLGVLVPLCLCAFLAVPCAAGTSQAAAKVGEGLAAYRAGQYAQAAEAFAEADIARPDDPRITFNRATALAAQGEAEQAIELFQKAGLGSVPGLSARARYNLGCLAAARARKLFGEHPEEATPEVRQQGLELLDNAVGHLRDCLQLESDHSDARHNLEVIRLWIKHMQALWQDRDRQKQRKEMDLLQFLQMLDQRQRALRAVSAQLDREPDSPKRRQAATEAESAQRELAEEVPVLKEKLETAAAQAGSPGPAAAPAAGAAPARPELSPEVKKAVEALQEVSEASAKAMLIAADRLHGSRPGEALGPQTEAVEKLDEVYRAVAPFPNLVQRALQSQNSLVEQNPASAENATGPTSVAERPGTPKPKVEESPVAKAGGEKSSDVTEVDLEQAAWEQVFVGRWSDAMPAKAQQGLKELETTESAAATASGTVPAPTGVGPTGPTGAAVADPEAEKKQREGLRRSMQLAITLAPKIHTLSGEAAGALKGRKPAAALPKQQEALKLLKEIAEPLPKQQQPQEQEPQDSKQDEKQQDQPQGDQQKQDQQKQDQQGQEQKQSQPKPGEMTRQQAEALLRQAQQRQRERQQMEKQLQDRLYRPGPVEKDW